MIKGTEKWDFFSYLGKGFNILYVYVPIPMYVVSKKVLEELRRVVGPLEDTIAKVSFYGQDEPGFVFEGFKNLPTIYYEGDAITYNSDMDLEKTLNSILKEKVITYEMRLKISVLKGDEDII